MRASKTQLRYLRNCVLLLCLGVAAREEFQRARSPQAKHARERAILDAARAMATERGVRSITLTDIAGAVGMHKSAMLRYFETRDQIFLVLTGEAWREWSRAVRHELDRLPALADNPGSAPERIPLVAEALAGSLVARPLFCDLLAHTPLSLERNVSLEAVRAFKVIALAEAVAVAASLRRLVPVTADQAADVVATATSMAGALWQMAAPGTDLRELYRTDPELAHALVDVGPRLTAILSGLLTGFTTLSH
jgi:AcrR family transcriptional regulator